MKNLHHYINLIESTNDLPKYFYHGSAKKLPVGTILTGRGQEYEKDWSNGPHSFYHILETYRPKNMIAQKNALFMCKSIEDVMLAGANTDYIFTLEPLGKIEKHDLNWASEIDCLVSEDANEDALMQAALNYWNGVPHQNEQVWEYLTTGAKIIDVNLLDDFD